MLPGSELAALVKEAGFVVESLTTWDKPREFEEWMGIVNDASRVAPLRAVVRALANAGVSAGIGLAIDGEQIRLFHRWNLYRRAKAGEPERVAYALLAISRTRPTVSSIMPALTSRWVQALMRPSIMASSTPR